MYRNGCGSVVAQTGLGLGGGAAAGHRFELGLGSGDRCLMSCDGVSQFSFVFPPCLWLL